jgi:hypothetical protein
MSRPRPERGRSRFAGWMSAIASWFRPSPILDPFDTYVIDDPFTFETPALDDAYLFLASARLQWEAKGKCYEETLTQEIERRRARFRLFVDDTVREVAREFAPHRAKEAEAEINRRLKGVRVISNGIQLECTAVTRLLPAAPVVQQQQQIWHKRIEREARHEAIKREIAGLRELRGLWRDFLSEGMDDWITPHAVRLAEEPVRVAAVSESMLDDRKNEAEQLVGMVNRVVAAQQGMDIFDYVVSSETVLRNTLKMMGVPVPIPDPGDGSLFTDSAKSP